MKKILFIMACMTGVFMASCEKDPDMGELDADLEKMFIKNMLNGKKE